MTEMWRQLPDNPYQVNLVPPLPLPVLPEPFSMRFARPYDDAEMLSEWMNRPHLATTWQQAYPPDWWRRYLSNQFEGRFSRPYIGSVDGQDFAYIELFRAAQDVLATIYEADPHDVGVHGANADPAMIQKGYGSDLFRHTIASVFSAEPQCRRIVGDSGPDSDSPGRRFNEHVGGVLTGTGYVAKLNRLATLFAWPRSPEDLPRLRNAPAPG